MSSIDLSPLLKLTARLLDLHDSRRASGESPQYQSEQRPGLGNGRYVAIAQEILDVLQGFDARTGDEYSSLHSIQQGVITRISWVTNLDIEYVLNVLSRPTELKLLHGEDGVPDYVIGDKETNLIEKAAHVVEYRLSRVGKMALVIASDNLDITYIEGDVTKLIRAIEAGRLTAALGFVERLLQQLRSEHLALIALIEKACGGRRSRPEAIAELELYRETMRRTVHLVEDARFKVDEIIRKEIPMNDDVPIGLIKAKVKEISGGVVRYGRELTRLAELSMLNAPSTVEAPAFQDLARQWVKTPPSSSQINAVLSILGPAPALAVFPMGTDFAGIVKTKAQKAAQAQSIELDGFDPPIEDQFTDWLRQSLPYLENQLKNGGVTLQDALREGLGQVSQESTLNCLITALTAPDEWVQGSVHGQLDRDLECVTLPGLQVMFSSFKLQMADNATREVP